MILLSIVHQYGQLILVRAATYGGQELLAVAGVPRARSQLYHVGNCATRDGVGRAVFLLGELGIDSV
jgi:hypothetical protein